VTIPGGSSAPTRSGDDPNENPEVSQFSTRYGVSADVAKSRLNQQVQVGTFIDGLAESSDFVDARLEHSHEGLILKIATVSGLLPAGSEAQLRVEGIQYATTKSRLNVSRKALGQWRDVISRSASQVVGLPAAEIGVSYDPFADGVTIYVLKDHLTDTQSKSGKIAAALGEPSVSVAELKVVQPVTAYGGIQVWAVNSAGTFANSFSCTTGFGTYNPQTGGTGASTAGH